MPETDSALNKPQNLNPIQWGMNQLFTPTFRTRPMGTIGSEFEALRKNPLGYMHSVYNVVPAHRVDPTLNEFDRLHPNMMQNASDMVPDPRLTAIKSGETISYQRRVPADLYESLATKYKHAGVDATKGLFVLEQINGKPTPVHIRPPVGMDTSGLVAAELDFKPNSQWYSFSVNANVRLGQADGVHSKLGSELTVNYQYGRDPETTGRVGFDLAGKPTDAQLRQQTTYVNNKLSVEATALRVDRSNIRNVEDPRDPRNGLTTSFLSPGGYVQTGLRNRQEVTATIGGTAGARAFGTAFGEAGVSPGLFSVGGFKPDSWRPGYGEEGSSWVFKEGSYFEAQIYGARAGINTPGVGRNTWLTVGVDPAAQIVTTGLAPPLSDFVNPASYALKPFDKLAHAKETQRAIATAQSDRKLNDAINSNFQRFAYVLPAVSDKKLMGKIARELDVEGKKSTALAHKYPDQILKSNARLGRDEAGFRTAQVGGKTVAAAPVEVALKMADRAQKTSLNFRQWAFQEVGKQPDFTKEIRTNPRLAAAVARNNGEGFEDGKFQTREDAALYLAIRAVASKNVNGFSSRQDTVYVEGGAGQAIAKDLFKAYKRNEQLLGRYFGASANAYASTRIPLAVDQTVPKPTAQQLSVQQLRSDVAKLQTQVPYTQPKLEAVKISSGPFKGAWEIPSAKPAVLPAVPPVVSAPTRPAYDGATLQKRLESEVARGQKAVAQARVQIQSSLNEGMAKANAVSDPKTRLKLQQQVTDQIASLETARLQQYEFLVTRAGPAVATLAYSPKGQMVEGSTLQQWKKAQAQAQNNLLQIGDQLPQAYSTFNKTHSQAVQAARTSTEATLGAQLKKDAGSLHAEIKQYESAFRTIAQPSQSDAARKLIEKFSRQSTAALQIKADLVPLLGLQTAFANGAVRTLSFTDGTKLGKDTLDRDINASASKLQKGMEELERTRMQLGKVLRAAS